MNESEFVAELSSTLAHHSDSARQQLQGLLASLPDRATRLDLVVFPSQDEDGFFTIRASVDGPDLYVINKAIDSHADLFDAKYTETGVEPPIPIIDPFDVDYPVNDLVVDCAAKWLQSLWQSLGEVECSISVMVAADEGYGTTTPFELHSGIPA